MDMPAIGPLAPRRRPRMLVALFAAVAALTVGSGVFSLALFTDTAAGSAAFSTGTIDIATSPSTLFTVTAAMPGDSGSATLTVQNSGTAQLRYALSTSATNADAKALRDQLQVTVKAGTCPGSTVLYGPGTLASTAIGSSAQGSQAGDRTLAAGASEDLCFSWSLPAGTGNAYQGAATTATFTFDAEQTANNP